MSGVRIDRRTLLAGAAAALASPRPARAAPPVRLAVIDPFSGPLADIGDEALRHIEYCAAAIDPRLGGGATIEVFPFDSRLDRTEALAQFEAAVGQGLRILVHGFGSTIASALVEAVAAHNLRRPDDPLLYLNYGAIDPVLTGARCSYWHFRFEADVDMKMAAVTEWLRRRSDITRVYVLGQDYGYGRAVAAAAVRQLKKKRPDVEVVGRELHPVGQIEDFAPYVERMRETGAQAVVTCDWGSDLANLLKAAADAGFDVPILTFYGGTLGAQAAISRPAIGIVRQVSEFHSNVEGAGLDRLIADFKARTGRDFRLLRVRTMLEMVARAAARAGPAAGAIARALEGLRHATPTGEVVMRADNHQLLQPLFVSTVSDEVRFDVYDTGLGFKTDLRLDALDTLLPTSCAMARP